MDERIKKIAEHYGFEAQADKSIEEMAELIVAIKHIDAEAHPHLSESEARQNFLNFLEELADVKIMVSQAEYILENENPSAFEQYKRNIDLKLDRQLERIRNEE